MQGYHSNREHLFDELRRLDLLLNTQIARQRRDPARGSFNQFHGLFLSEDEIDRIVEKTTIEPVSGSDQGASEIGMLLSTIDQLQQQIAAKIAAARQRNVALALPSLAQLFRLTPFDVDALLVCVAPEMDLKYGKLYAYLQDDVTRKMPSVDLILTLLCRSLEEKLKGRARLSSDAPLMKHCLVRYYNNGHDEPPGLLGRSLRTDGRILNYLLDMDVLDEQLTPFTQLIAPRVTIDELLLPSEITERFVPFFQSQIVAPPHNTHAASPTFLLHGPRGAGKNVLAQALCQSLGITLLVANLQQMLSSGTAFAALMERLLREARLRSSAVYLDHAEALASTSEQGASVQRTLLQALEEFPGIAFIGSERPWDSETDLHTYSLFTVALPTPTYMLRRQLWRTLLARSGHTVAEAVDVDALADKFGFTAGKIHATITHAGRLATMRPQKDGAISGADLYQACRALSGTGLATLARKITPLYTWDDIILPNSDLEHLKEICTHVRYRQQVFGHWGFHRKFSLGKGLSSLFLGPSGTGKTMAAEIMASELRLDLYKIDLSCVVSKYIGETEKNLAKIFREAEESNAILFFDEADAIFGKRSEVKDSHDRYANTEINYLLQKMEEYEGIVILASNFKKNIDDAFTRRMRFVVEFPFPEQEYRYRIWKSVFPKDTPLSSDIDFGFLAGKLKIAGGNIRNIALNAAFLAAAKPGEIRMEHIIRSTKREFQKMGRLCVKSEFEQYFDWVSGES